MLSRIFGASSSTAERPNRPERPRESEEDDDFLSVVSEPVQSGIPATFVRQDVTGLLELAESDDDGDAAAPRSAEPTLANPPSRPPPDVPCPLPVVSRDSEAVPLAAPPTSSVGQRRGRGGGTTRPSYRYGSTTSSTPSAPAPVVLRPSAKAAAAVRRGALSQAPASRTVVPVPKALATPVNGPLDWRNASSVPPQTVPRPSARPSDADDLGRHFEPLYRYDDAHLVPKNVERATHAERYAWIWQWASTEDTTSTREWREAFKCERSDSGERCYGKLAGRYAVDHPVVAGLIGDNFPNDSLAGRVLVCQGILNSSRIETLEGDKDLVYAPSAGALLRYCHSCRAPIHLVTLHTVDNRPSSPCLNTANLFSCCHYHAQQALTRLLRSGFNYPFREGGFLFFARSVKSFSSPYRGQDGRPSGLSPSEARMALMWAHTRRQNIQDGIPPTPFNIRDDEWILTTKEQATMATRSSGSTLGGQLSDLGENIDDVLTALTRIADEYTTYDPEAKRKRPWEPGSW